MDSMLWDIYIMASYEASIFDKWQMWHQRNEYGHIGGLFLHEQEGIDHIMALVKYWRINQECMSKDMSIKG
jgi:hypothetical protein